MTSLVLALAILAQQPRADSVAVLARHAPDSVLGDAVRRWPMDARDALRRLKRGGSVSDSSGIAALTAALRLGGAIAIAWNDSFPLRWIERFRSLSAEDRLAAVAADSLLRAGGAAARSRGIAAAMPLWRESLRRFESVGDTAGIARVLTSLGSGFFDAQQYDSAATYTERARDLAERIGDYFALGNAMGNLAGISGVRGDLESAAEHLERAKPIRERIGDVAGLAADQGNLGVVHRKRGDLVRARRAYEAALAASRVVPDSDGMATNLVNLGNLISAWEGGDREEAAHAYREALAIRRARGQKLGIASILYNSGLSALTAGEYPSAVSLLSEAASIVREVGAVGGSTFEPALPLSRARGAMGDLPGARAELDRAEAFTRQRGGGGREASLAWIALGRADLAAAFNQLAEAERQFTRALRLVNDHPNAAVQRIVELQARYGLVDVLIRRGDYRRAKIAIDQLSPNLAAGDFGGIAMVRVMAGQMAWRQGDSVGARRVLSEAIDTLHRAGWDTEEVRALAVLASLELEAGRTSVAESLYRRGLSGLAGKPAPGLSWPLHAGLARIWRGRHDLDAAAVALQTAIAQIERVSGTLRIEEQRAAFRIDKWRPYIELALVERARGRTAAAFEASEQLRARQMLDILSRGRIAGSRTSERLVRREQDLRRRIANLALRTDSGQGTAQNLRSARAAPKDEALSRAQDEYAELLVEMREANPEYAALVKAEIVSAGDVMNALEPDEALLEYLVSDSTTVVFVVTRDSVASLDLRVGHNSLSALVDFARSTLVAPANQRAGPDWRPPLRRLYAQLVAPVESRHLLDGKRRILIAPHGELHYVPFAALVRRGSREQFLIERYTLEYVPSASVWLRLRQRPAHGDGGVLAMAPQPAGLPGSRAEVEAIQRAYGDQALALVGRAATESVFRAMSPGREIVHLATHGVLNKTNPLFSYVQLGAGGGEDGRLEVHEAFGLTLDARLLVLSACQTGAAAGSMSDVPPGDDWVGLVNAFLFAGARNVLGTLWPVQDASTARLMRHFYRELGAGRAETEALALAQRTALRDPPRSHPFYWAAFSLVRGN